MGMRCEFAEYRHVKSVEPVPAQTQSFSDLSYEIGLTFEESIHGIRTEVEKGIPGLISSGSQLMQDGFIPSFVQSAKNIFLRIGSRPKSIRTTHKRA